MAGTWKTVSIAGMTESPEANWMREIMHRDGRQWCSVRLSRRYAGCVIEAFRRRRPAGMPDAAEPADLAGWSERFEKLVGEDLRIAQSSFSALCRFVRRGHEGTVETEFLAPQSVRDALAGLQQEGEFEVTDVSPPSRDFWESAEDHEVPAEEEEPGARGADDDTVIIAVIDDGIGVANHRFRSSGTETRIEHFLDMNGRQADTARTWDAGAAPNVGANGRAWSRKEIEALLRRYPDDEEAVYRAMQMIDPRSDRRQPLKFRGTHGTHVLDLAAGYDYRKPAELALARKRPIIAVQLPSEIVADRSDAEMPRTLKAALEWIEVMASDLSSRAMSAGKRASFYPIVLNFSFGVFAGPHDGLGQVEQRISEFIRHYGASPGSPQCEVVLPAGNGLQARAIARQKAGPAGSDCEPMPWRVLPDDKTSSVLQIWLPEADTARQQVRVSVTPPRDAPSGPAGSELNKALDWDIGGTTYARIYHQQLRRPNGRWRERVTIAIRPTGSETDEAHLSPAGLWTVTVTNIRLPEGADIDLRVQRDDPVSFERPKGRQSCFDHPDYVRFEPDTGRLRNDERLDDEGPVSRQRTLSAYATADDTVVVGGYRRSDGTPAAYSCAGPATSDREGPTLSAVCEESPSMPGVAATGTYTGSRFVMNGTSVAAPLVTRELADAIAKGGDRETVLKKVRDAEKAGIIGPHGRYRPAWRGRYGDGRLVTAPGADSPA